MAEKPKLLNEFMTPEKKKEFRKREEEMTQLKGMLAMFKEMGLDTKVLEDKIEWADKMMKIMTKHLGI